MQQPTLVLTCSLCLSPCSEDGRGEGDVAVAAGEQGEESAGLQDDEQSEGEGRRISGGGRGGRMASIDRTNEGKQRSWRGTF